MDKDWKLIIASAVCGLLVSAAIYVYLSLSGEFDAYIYTTFLVLCPPSLLCIPFSEAMKVKGVFYAVWSLIGVSNSGLYAVVGAAVVGLRKPKLNSPRSRAGPD